MPPKWMWHLDWEMEKWWSDVKYKRENPLPNEEEEPWGTEGEDFMENDLLSEWGIEFDRS